MSQLQSHIWNFVNPACPHINSIRYDQAVSELDEKVNEYMAQGRQGEAFQKLAEEMEGNPNYLQNTMDFKAEVHRAKGAVAEQDIAEIRDALNRLGIDTGELNLDKAVNGPESRGSYHGMNSQDKTAENQQADVQRGMAQARQQATDIGVVPGVPVSEALGVGSPNAGGLPAPAPLTRGAGPAGSR